MNWNNDANWNGGATPGATDDVTIANQGSAAIIVSGAAADIHSLLSDNAIEVTHGTSFTLEGGPSAVHAAFKVDSGASVFVNSGANITVDQLTWDGGTLAGSGSVTTPNLVMDTDQVLAGNQVWQLDQGMTLQTTGTAVIQLSQSVAGSALLDLGDGTEIDNKGTFTVDLASSNQLVVGATGPSGVAKFVNDGTFVNDAASPGPIFAANNSGGGVEFDNLGSVSITNGSLALEGGGKSGDGTGMQTSFSVSAGTGIWFGGVWAFDSGSTISGAGNVRFDRATATVAGTYDIAGGTIADASNVDFSGQLQDKLKNIGPSLTILDDGRVNLYSKAFTLSTLTVTFGSELDSNAGLTVDQFLWGGGTISGSGSVTTPNLVMDADHALAGNQLWSLDQGMTLNTTNRAVLQLTEPVAGANALLDMGDGTQIVNTGTFTVQLDSAHQLMVGATGLSGVAKFVNYGTFIHAAQGPVSVFESGSNSAGMEFDNYGTVSVTNGDLSLQGGGISGDGTSATPTSFSVAPNAGLEFGGAWTFNSASSVSGDGSVAFEGALTVATGTVQFSGGTLSGSFAVAAGTELDLIGNFDLTGGATATGPGLLENLGTITVVASANTAFSGLAFTNQGTVDVQGGGSLGFSGGTKTWTAASSLIVEASATVSLGAGNDDFEGSAQVDGNLTMSGFGSTVHNFPSNSKVFGRGFVTILGGGSKFAGVYNIVGGTEVSSQLHGATPNAFTGSGITSLGQSLSVGGGTAAIFDVSGLSVDSLETRNANVTLGNPFTVGDELIWTGSNANTSVNTPRIGGTGTLTVQNNGSDVPNLAAYDPNVTPNLWLNMIPLSPILAGTPERWTLDGETLVSEGQAVLNSPSQDTSNDGLFNFQNSASFVNEGAFTALNPVSMTFDSLDGTPATFTNSGIFTVSGAPITFGPSAVNSGSAGVAFQNSGTLNVQTGTVSFLANSPTATTFTQTSSGQLEIQISGTTAGTSYGQLVVNGNVTLDGTLNVSAINAFVPSPGDTYTIVHNTGSGPVNGTFAGLPEGATVTVGGQQLVISYQGGTDHQDVTLSDPLPVNTATINTDLSSVVAANQGSGQATAVTYQATTSTQVNSFLSALAAVPASSTTNTVNLYVNLGGGNFTGQTATVPQGTTLTFVNGTFTGHSPALTVMSGQVAVVNSTLTNSTNAPTILVQGGSLTLRNDTIQESTGADQAAILVTGGTLDLGTMADPGGNTLNVNGEGDLIRAVPGSVLSDDGNTYEISGQVPTNAFRIGDAIFDTADSGTGNSGDVSNTGQLTLAPAATRSVAASFTQTSAGALTEQLGGLVPGSEYGQLVVTGPISLAGALTVTPINGFGSTTGEIFTVIRNDGTAPISGTFAALAEGAVLTIGGRQLKISYVGNSDHQDVTLTDVTPVHALQQNSTGNVVLTTFTVANPSAAATDFTFSVNWGGTLVGTPSVSVQLVSQTSATSTWQVVGSATYAADGNYTAVVTVTDAAANTVSTNSVTFGVDDIRLLLLDPNGSGALSDIGNGSVVVGGAGDIAVASTSPTAVTLNGNGNVSAAAIDLISATGTQIKGKGTIRGVIVPGFLAAEAADPLASLPVPASPSATYSAVNYSGSAALTLQPGTYVGGIHVSGSGTVTLAAGIYYLEGGGFSVSGSGSVIGSGVLIYNAPQTSADTISLSGKGSVILTAPTSGTYQGIAIFQDRSSTAPISIGGSGGVNLTGTLYAAGAKVGLGSNGPLAIQGAGRLIAADLQVTGNGSVTVNIAGSSGGSTQRLTTEDGSGDTGLATLVSSTGLAAGMFTVAVDDLSGTSQGADEEARIEDAIATLDAELAPYGISLVEVFGDAAASANIHIHVATTSSIGGMSDGVLGVTVGGNDITLIAGWNWYAGADPSLIAANQYDFQTVAMHELGHASGLGHSQDAGSVMYAMLAAGAVRRDLTAADLTVLDAGTDNQPEPLMAAPGFGARPMASAPGGDRVAVPPGVAIAGMQMTVDARGPIAATAGAIIVGTAMPSGPIMACGQAGNNVVTAAGLAGVIEPGSDTTSGIRAILADDGDAARLVATSAPRNRGGRMDPRGGKVPLDGAAVAHRGAARTTADDGASADSSLLAPSAGWFDQVRNLDKPGTFAIPAVSTHAGFVFGTFEIIPRGKSELLDVLENKRGREGFRSRVASWILSWIAR